MSNYKIVICKSAEVAYIISKGFGRPEGWIRTGHGAVTANLAEFIPSIYHDKGYFYAMVETECNDDHPTYELIFA